MLKDLGPYCISLYHEMHVTTFSSVWAYVSSEQSLKCDFHEDVCGWIKIANYICIYEL